MKALLRARNKPKASMANCYGFYVVEFSVYQNAFHVEDVMEMIKTNIECSMRGTASEYVPIGIFETYEEASDYCSFVMKRMRQKESPGHSIIAGGNTFTLHPPSNICDDPNIPTEKKKEFAKQLRRRSTISENILWGALQKQQLGIRFKRQAVLFGFIADFYAPSFKIAVELDGKYHEQQRDYDMGRDSILLQRGIITLRFPSALVFHNLHWILQIIRHAIEVRSKE